MKSLLPHVLQAERRQQEIIRDMTPKRRLEIALSLYRSAWEIKKGALRSDHPEWTEQRIEAATRRIFLTGHAGS